MPEVADMLSPASRECLERARELAKLDRLIRQVPEQQPPPPPPTLNAMSATATNERTAQ